MDCSKNLIRHIISFLATDFESCKCDDMSLDDMKECIGYFSFLMEEAFSAVRYLCKDKIESFEDLAKFDNEFGGTASVDSSSEAIFGYEWRTQHKEGFIPDYE